MFIFGEVSFHRSSVRCSKAMMSTGLSEKDYHKIALTFSFICGFLNKVIGSKDGKELSKANSCCPSGLSKYMKEIGAGEEFLMKEWCP